MKIYTRTGDDGTTGLFAGGRVPKDDPRVAAYGTVDELSAAIGLARAHGPSTEGSMWLRQVQYDLFNLGADLATPHDFNAEWLQRVVPAQVHWLEDRIDAMDATLPTLTNFILSGGTPAAAALHVARTVCRRAERAAVTLGSTEAINPNAAIYLNRLSDFLFTLARFENQLAGVPDEVWTSGR